MTRKPTKKAKRKVNKKIKLGTGPCEPEARSDGRHTWVEHTIDNCEDVHGAIMLEPREELDEAIVGVTEGYQRFVYSYEKLVAAHAAMMSDEDEPELAAQEWVDYNTVRGVVYMGDRAPLRIYERAENSIR